MNVTSRARRSAAICTSRRAHSKPCVIHDRFPLPLSADGYFSIPRAEYGKSFTEIYSLSKNRFNPYKWAKHNKPGTHRIFSPMCPGFITAPTIIT